MPPARRSRLPRTRRPRPRQALTDELAASQAGLNHSGRAQVAVARRCLGQFEEDPPTKPQTVTVIEPVPGDWQVLTSSHTYEKIQAHTLKYQIPVPKEGAAKLAYRVRIRF